MLFTDIISHSIITIRITLLTSLTSEDDSELLLREKLHKGSSLIKLRKRKTAQRHLFSNSPSGAPIQLRSQWIENLWEIDDGENYLSSLTFELRCPIRYIFSSYDSHQVHQPLEVIQAKFQTCGTIAILRTHHRSNETFRTHWHLLLTLLQGSGKRCWTCISSPSHSEWHLPLRTEWLPTPRIWW